MKRYFYIVKQNLLKYKAHIVLSLSIFVLLAIIIVFDNESKKDLDNQQFNQNLENKHLEITINDYSTNVLKDYYLNYSVSDDLNNLCQSDEFNCFVFAKIYIEEIDEFRTIGPLLQFQLENKEYILPNKLTQSYGVDLDKFRVKLTLIIVDEKESNRRFVDSEEFEVSY